MPAKPQFIFTVIGVIALAVLFLLSQVGGNVQGDLGLEAAAERVARLTMDVECLESQIAIARRDLDIANKEQDEYQQRLAMLRAHEVPSIFVSGAPRSAIYDMDRAATEYFSMPIARAFPAEPVRGSLSEAELERLLAECSKQVNDIPLHIESVEFELNKARERLTKAEQQYEALKRSKATS